MNASTSSSSSSPSPSRRVLLQRALPAGVQPLLACGGALLLGAVFVRLLPAADSSNAVSVSSAQAPVLPIIPSSQLVTARAASLAKRTLQGAFRLTTEATGKSPVNGAVARHVVQVGSHVEAGDSVVEISSGAGSRAPLPAETKQNEAEHEQVQAAQGQSALAGQMARAETQLSVAKERVTRAQERVATTRALVKRLLTGESIPLSAVGLEEKQAISARTSNHERRKREPISDNQQRDDDALAQAQSALRDATAQHEEAQKALTEAQRRVDDTKTALSKAQEEFKAAKITADVLQDARAEVEDAARALQSAQQKADASAQKLQSSQAKVDQTKAKAQATLDATASDENSDGSTNTSASRFLSADQAAEMVASALKESKAAARSAERLQAKVDAYQRQVQSTNQRVQSASNDLVQAQQDVLNSTPRPVFVAARAPRAGTITWISSLAREVNAGDAVFGLSGGSSGFFRFEDRTNAWKALRVGQLLDAAPTPSIAIASPSMQSSKPSSPAPTPTVAGTFTLQITQIKAPESANQPAVIEAKGGNAPLPEQIAAGVQAQLPMEAATSSPATGAPATVAAPVVVPASVILPRDGKEYVAVVSQTAPSSVGGTSPDKSTQLEWRVVEVGRETPFEVELTIGVKDGDQVVSQPALLLANWKPEAKQPLRVQLEPID